MPPSLKDSILLTFMNKDALTSGITYDLTVKDARSTLPAIYTPHLLRCIHDVLGYR
jgi:hypothetical protein